MRKYGIENFKVELVEETDHPNEREVYWIERESSFKYGYNATKGGDGKTYLDYDLIASTYSELQNIALTAKKLNISPDSVRNVLSIKQLPIKSSSVIAKENYGKSIKAFDLQGNYIKSFSTLKDAARYLISEKYTNTQDLSGITSHIRNCANLKRKTAYKHIWKWE